MDNYYFLQELLLRSPVYSYSQYSPDKISSIIQDQLFKAALYLASPQLFEAIFGKAFDELNAGEKLSLMRYYNRMSFRPTPFGSFSSFSPVKWGENNIIQLAGKLDGELHLHFDQKVVLRLIKGLDGYDISDNRYTCNPALYQSGKDFRFIRTSYSPDKGKISFDLESIESNPLNAALFSFCKTVYKRGEDIIAFMIEVTGCDRETARDYLNFLIDATIFLPDTASNIVGEDYLTRLLQHPGFPASVFKQKLINLYNQLSLSKNSDVGNLIQISAKINELLSNLGQRAEKQVFYAGLERKVVSGEIDNRHQTHILDGLKALNILAQPAQASMLQQFISDFKNRYDKQKVLLVQAIDPELGIGYGPLIFPGAEPDLMRDINFTTQQRRKVLIEWSSTHRLLLKKWNENVANKDPIMLSESDLSGLQAEESLQSPPTLPVVFRVLENGIYIETAGGASATALIGRFTLFSKQIHDLSLELARKEKEASPCVVFADIGQLSDTHADNINRRQHIYDYEILINAISTLPLENQIPLTDLWISVAGDELVLESRRLKKVVVPRLTSAYNYVRNNLAPFRFLCDLQYQGLQSNYSFDLETYFPGMAFYPRVVYKQTILSAAVWHLTPEDLKSVKGTSDKGTVAKFYMLMEKLKLPAVVALSKFDQQLVFNLNREDDVAFLLDCLNGMDKAVLQEFFMPAVSTVTSEGMPLISQFIGFLYKKETAYNGTITPDLPDKSKIKQEYILGSTWLYLKLYCAPAIANDILIKRLLPVLKQFDKSDLLTWFFVRYRDSGYHLRLRLKVKEHAISPVLVNLKKRLEETVHYHLIREYQADTYRREMERYSAEIMELVEDFFQGSSNLVLYYIQAAGNKTFSYSYHSLAFVSIADLLNIFMPEINQQIIFLEQMVNTFYSEFSSDKLLKIDLDQKFRELKGEIKGLLSNDKYYKSLKMTVWADQYALKIALLFKATVSFSSKRSTQLLADLVHMHLNRLFVDRQRNQELIVYYCLYKHQLAVRAISKRKY